MTTGSAVDRAGWLGRRGWPTSRPVVLAALIAVIWLAYVRPLTHFDIDVFLRAGAAVGGGRDPYPAPGSPAVYSGFAFVYPYLVAVPFVPLARLPRAAAEALFIALSVASVLAGCWLAGARRLRAYALVLAASCTIIGLQMGTLNALLFAGLAALWRARDRPLVAGLLAALLVYSKLFLAPVPLWLLLTRRWRAAGAATGWLAVLFALGQWVSPIGLGTYSGMLAALARAEAPNGLSLTGLLMNAGLGLGAATWTARAVAVAALLACWRLAGLRVAARSPGLPGSPAAHGEPAEDTSQAAAVPVGDRLMFAAGVAAALLASPIVWSHYLLLLAVPLLVLEGGRRTGALAVGTALSWLLVTPHLSTPADLAASACVLALLVTPPLWDAARRVAAARLAWPGGRGVAAGTRPWQAALGALALGAIAIAGLELCWWLARVHHGADAVTGAYLATLAVLVLLGWGARRTGAGAGHTLPSPHRCPPRPVRQVP